MPHDAEDAPVFTLEYPYAEVVIGIVCAGGADYTKISEFLVRTLPTFGYRANVLKVSSFISETAKSLNLRLRLSARPEARRLKDHMDAGNKIRKETDRCDFFALIAASRLASSRKGAASDKPEPFSRVAHIILSLKRPEEVETLRRIYGTGFFLVGVFATEQERLDFLMDERDVSKAEAVRLIRRDLEDEDKDFGQRTRDTFHRADVFVELQGDRFKKELRRFLQLIFGYPYSTPTHDEFGMYHAYSSSLRSAQLGRQVGAAILNSQGDLIAVGCNEVPSAGGGSYWEGQEPDHRDHVRKEDSNDMRKTEIIKDIIDRLRKANCSPALKRGNPRLMLYFEAASFGTSLNSGVLFMQRWMHCSLADAAGLAQKAAFCTRPLFLATIAQGISSRPEYDGWYTSSLTRRARPHHFTKTRYELKMPSPESPAGEQEISVCHLNRSSAWGRDDSSTSFR
jgi:deoxycytidylate deaminase